jgi:hypothetical protein
MMLSLPIALALAGCDYSSSAPPQQPTGVLHEPAVQLTRTGPIRASAAASTASIAEGEEQRERKKAILDAVMNLIESAPLKPGGDNFRLAIQKLNDYFKGTPPARYALSPQVRSYLQAQRLAGNPIQPQMFQEFEMPVWRAQDTRHIEDCMLYYGLATREAGNGDDLARVSRVFDWVIRHVLLVPDGALSDPQHQIRQAQARPYDVLLRGMATEEGGGWSERGWLFVSLCRQLGIDAGLLTYSTKDAKEPIAWICGVLIDKQIYLFDPRIGMPVPGPDGTGVATLADALADPVVLERMDLPGQSPYMTTRDDLAHSPTKIGVLIDSSPGYFSPRMRMLEKELVGKDRTILYRDPVEQSEQFAEALGSNFGGARLWDMPIFVQTMLFNSGQFVEATLISLKLFDPQLPILIPRVKQLRGDTKQAIEDYVKFRFAEQLKLNLPKAEKDRFLAAARKSADPAAAKKAIEERERVSPEVQKALDAYATYFLALAHLDQGNAKQAEFFFNETLKLLPRYGRGQPFYTMFRWGAQSNLGRLCEERGDYARAIDCYSELAPTPQYHGDLLRARALVWRNPMGPPPRPLPEPATAPATATATAKK